jgi:hypothetical protein
LFETQAFSSFGGSLSAGFALGNPDRRRNKGRTGTFCVRRQLFTLWKGGPQPWLRAAINAVNHVSSLDRRCALRWRAVRSVTRSITPLSEEIKAMAVISAPTKFQTRTRPTMRAGSSANPRLL